MSLLSQFFPSGGGGGAGGESLSTGGFTIDFLLVGGGGGGGSLNPCAFPCACISPASGISPATASGGGGGGGKVFQVIGANVQIGVEYPITIGAGGAANSNGNTSRFGDFVAGGGGAGGGDPNNGIASYYKLSASPSYGSAGGDAMYCDNCLLCMCTPSTIPLRPLYTTPDLTLRSTGNITSINPCGTVVENSIFGRAIVSSEHLTSNTAGNIYDPVTSGTPRAPQSPSFFNGCGGGGSTGCYYQNFYPSPSFAGPVGGYLDPGCITISPLGFYCACYYENEIFKRNNVNKAKCFFGRGGGAGGTFACNLPSYYTQSCYFRLETGQRCFDDMLDSVWQCKLNSPGNSGSLPAYNYFCRDEANLSCGTKNNNGYLYLSNLFLCGQPVARGAHGEFLPVSNAKMRFAMASGFYADYCSPLTSPFIGFVINCQAQSMKQAGSALVDLGPIAGCEYYPYIISAPIIADGGFASYQRIGSSDSIDNAYRQIKLCAPTYVPGWGCFFRCSCFQQGYGFNPTGGVQSFRDACRVRLFTCADSGLNSWASPCGCLSGCLNAPASAAIVCEMMSGTPHIETVCWKPAESGIAGTGSGGGGGVRSQGYCDGCNNVRFRYAVTNVPFAPSPGFMTGNWKGISGAVSTSYPVIQPACTPWGIKCLQYCLPCTPPATLAGGQGGSGSLWIVYPSELPAATVTGNTPVPGAPPAIRVYYWEGNGSITFNQ